jgi:hypothetical protein
MQRKVSITLVEPPDQFGVSFRIQSLAQRLHNKARGGRELRYNLLDTYNVALFDVCTHTFGLAAFGQGCDLVKPSEGLQECPELGYQKSLHVPRFVALSKVGHCFSAATACLDRQTWFWCTNRLVGKL